MVTILKDLNDSPGATETWRAALAECPPPGGGDRERWCVAWGKCYAMLSSGVRPLGWSEDSNTDVDGVEWFDTLADAEAYLDDVADAARTG
jgi:hypothetical protein